MQKITPHLWFDKEAKEAARFYASIFPNSKITQIATIHEVPTPTGDCDIISFELNGQPFMAINAGPLFRFNPSISFIVHFDPSRDRNAKKYVASKTLKTLGWSNSELIRVRNTDIKKKRMIST